MKSDLDNSPKPEFPAPLVSFDWCPTNLDLILTGSIDSTCSVWNIKKGSCFYQLIAHDKEVYDVSFSPDEHIFASVGGDGTLRQFDLRTTDRSIILFETEKLAPLLRLAWNRRNPNYIATVEMDNQDVILIDIRKPLKVLTSLSHHKKSINSITWSPELENLICSAGDDMSAFIWNVERDVGPVVSEPLLKYSMDSEISNVNWSILQPTWVALTAGKKLEILKV